MTASWIKNKLNKFESSGYKNDLLSENQFEFFDGVLNYYEYQHINLNYKNALRSDLVKYEPSLNFWNGFNYEINPNIFKTLQYEYKDLLRNFIIAPYNEFWWYMPRGLFMNIPNIGKRGGFSNVDLPIVGCLRGKLFSEVFFRCEFGERDGLYIPASYLMPEVPRLTVFRQSHWGYTGFLFSKSLYPGKFVNWDIGLTDSYRRFKILSSWYHGFKIKKSMSEWGMRSNGPGPRTSTIMRHVYSKKSFLAVDCFAKLYINRIIANKVFFSLTSFNSINYNKFLFNTKMVYDHFYIDTNKLKVRYYLKKSYNFNINYHDFFSNSRFYNYFNTLGSMNSVSRLHNIINSRYGLTYALIKFYKYNLNNKIYITASKIKNLYKHKFLMLKKKSKRSIFFILNELRLINNRKFNILSKLKIFRNKYMKIGLSCLNDMNKHMKYVDEFETIKNYSFNYFVYLFLKILYRRNIVKTLKYFKRYLGYYKCLVKSERFCNKNKFWNPYNNTSKDIQKYNKFNCNEDKFLYKQLLFHNSLLDSIHLTADTYRKGINIKSSNSKFYIRLLKFSGIFATKTNLSGIGRFYKFRLKPRKKYFNKRFWFKKTRRFWRPKLFFKKVLGGTKRSMSSWDHALSFKHSKTEFYRINRVALNLGSRTVFHKLFSFKPKKNMILKWMNYLAFITRSLVLFNDYYNYNIAKRLLKKYIYVLIYLLRRRVNKYINSNSFIFGKYFCRYPILLASYIKDE